MKKFSKIARLTFAVLICWPVFVLAFLGIVVYSLFHVLKMEKTANRLSHFLYRGVCSWLLWALGAKIKVVGRKNLPSPDETVVYTPNHTSIMDVPLVYYGLKRFPSMMAKRELAKVPLVHGLLLSLRCVLINRTSAHGAVEAVHKSIEKVKSGDSLVIFPEGTRSKTGEIAAFKSGAFRIASSAEVRIVPVVINNVRYVFEGRGRWGRVPVTITFLPPVESKGLDKEGLKALQDSVEAQIRDCYSKEPLHKSW